MNGQWLAEWLAKTRESVNKKVNEILEKERWSTTDASAKLTRQIAASCVSDAAYLIEPLVREGRDKDWITAFVCALGYDRRMVAPTCPENVGQVLEHFKDVIAHTCPHCGCEETGGGGANGCFCPRCGETWGGEADNNVKTLRDDLKKAQEERDTYAKNFKESVEDATRLRQRINQLTGPKGPTQDLVLCQDGKLGPKERDELERLREREAGIRLHERILDEYRAALVEIGRLKGRLGEGGSAPYRPPSLAEVVRVHAVDMPIDEGPSRSPAFTSLTVWAKDKLASFRAWSEFERRALEMLAAGCPLDRELTFSATNEEVAARKAKETRRGTDVPEVDSSKQEEGP